MPRSFETGLAAYKVGATVAATQLRNGLIVIADAANYLEVGREIWRAAATQAQASTKVIEVTCSDEQLHRQRLTARGRRFEAYSEPAWDDVIRRRDETEPWTGDYLVLDSVRPVQDNVDVAVDYVGS